MNLGLKAYEAEVLEERVQALEERRGTFSGDEPDDNLASRLMDRLRLTVPRLTHDG